MVNRILTGQEQLHYSSKYKYCISDYILQQLQKTIYEKKSIIYKRLSIISI